MNGSLNSANYFSSTVTEATDKFIRACQSRHLSCRKIAHPLTGPSGERLDTSVAWYGRPDADYVILMIAGTHGIEGYAGAALITGTIAEGIYKSLPASVAVMFIHLINPWGCAWGHRHMENNADLFRDALYYKPDLFCDDKAFDQRYRCALTPSSWFGEARRVSDSQLEELIDQYGIDEVIRVARIGQHKYPDAQCYNGDGRSWSTRLYRELSEIYLAKARHIFCLDIHTGFGESGQGICIPYCDNSEAGKRKLKRLKETFGQEHIYQAGFDPTIPALPRSPWETIEDFIADVEMTCTGLEFGTVTYDLDTAINIHRYMNYLLVYGDLSEPDCKELYQQYQQLYYPQLSEWKASIYKAGTERVLDIIAWHNRYAQTAKRNA